MYVYMYAHMHTLHVLHVCMSLCYAVLCCVLFCSVLFCCVIYYFLLCYVVPCYVMSCCVMYGAAILLLVAIISLVM